MFTRVSVCTYAVGSTCHTEPDSFLVETHILPYSISAQIRISSVEALMKIYTFRVDIRISHHTSSVNYAFQYARSGMFCILVPK